MEIGDLLELQRPLHAGSIVQIPTDEEHIVVAVILLRQGRQIGVFFVSFRDLVCSLWVRYGQKYGTKELYYSAKKIFDCLLARDKEAVKEFITTSTMESIDGSRTIYYVD